MKCIIVGAGLGGLCLAQSLKQQKIEFTVYERGDVYDPKQGYRITVDEHGVAALRQCLPDRLFKAFLYSSGAPGGSFRYLNKRMDESFALEFGENVAIDDPTGLRQADRNTLRTILLSGIEDRIISNKPVKKVEQPSKDGPATVLFQDGGEASADLVVGADGVHSAVRHSLWPQQEPTKTGFAVLYGRTPLWRPDGSPAIPRELFTTGITTADSEGHAFFFTTMNFVHDPAEVFNQYGVGQTAPTRQPYVMWAFLCPQSELPAGIWYSSAPSIQALACKMAQPYHPFLRQLVKDGDESVATLTGINASERPEYWPLPHVTLIGDSCHVMPPFGAHGGNAALRDAALLAKNIHQVQLRDATLAIALDQYQQQMEEHAFADVETAKKLLARSMQPTAFDKWIAQTALPAMNNLRKGKFSKHFTI